VSPPATRRAAPAVPALRLAGIGETVFARYARLAVATGAVNLGQGFPDDPPHPRVLAALHAASSRGHQYAPMPGLPALRAAIATNAGRRLGRVLDPDREVHVTVGATEALYAALQALVDPGDEVVVVEPCYDAYPAMVRLAGGVPVAVPMELAGDGRWRLDPERLVRALGPRTRVVLLNDPHNPTGAVLDADEVAAVAAAAERAGAWLLVDEVYEHLAFVPTHPIARWAFDRTLSVGSAGKTFGVTGWKVGWVTGPAPLVAAVAALRQWVSFCVATPLQAAVAELLVELDGGGSIAAALAEARSGLMARRDVLHAALSSLGLSPSRPRAGYFIYADATAWGWDDDIALCDALPELAGVVAIPGSAFRVAPDPGRTTFLRFAFCRGEATVVEGARRLARLDVAALSGAAHSGAALSGAALVDAAISPGG
jgi:N-succinyldiaminopimelate aminotransferase